MIFDNIANRNRYSSHPDIAALLERMAQIDTGCFPSEKITVSDTAFINPSVFDSSPSSGRYEEHKRFADVHFILDGSERITVEQPEKLIPVEDYSPDRDIGFYSGNTGTVFILRPGDFLICWPGEAHEPGVFPEVSEKVIKLVGKFEV